MAALGQGYASATRSLEDQAKTLLRLLVDPANDENGHGSMSATIYDTAWVSCIKKIDAGHERWLFPRSFTFVLDAQGKGGGWHWPPSHKGACGSDCLLTSLAAVHAVQLHSQHALQSEDSLQLIKKSLQRGLDFLEGTALQDAALNADTVGFEALAPSLIRLVEQSCKIQVACKGRESLLKVWEAKLESRMRSKVTAHASPSLHSLEALYADHSLNFDDLQRFLVNGSMMSSPAATAVYLMRCSQWDDQAEAYLHRVNSCGNGGSGAMPSAYPSTIFELSWADRWKQSVSTLLQLGFTAADLGQNELQRAVSILNTATQGGRQPLGFAPGLTPDLDDTARSSVILSLLGQPSLAALIKEGFEGQTHFETYKGEQNSSISANCNAAMALLLDKQETKLHDNAINKIVSFLCQEWADAEGGFPTDKWNISPYYTVMLLSQALIEALRSHQQRKFLIDSVARDALLVTFQCFTRMLASQNEDGSWGCKGPREETAYSLIALSQLRCMTLATHFQTQLSGAIDSGLKHLSTRSGDALEYLWTEKVRYGSQVLRDTYVLAAQRAFADTTKASPEGNIGCDRHILPSSHMAKATRLMSSLQLFRKMPQWLVEASWVESRLFAPGLMEQRDTVFRREGFTKDDYLAWIPFMWTISNNRNTFRVSNKFMLNMMIISLLNFQADEFMEAVVGPFVTRNGSFDKARMVIDDAVMEVSVEKSTVQDLPTNPSSDPSQLSSPAAGSSPPSKKRLLSGEIKPPSKPIKTAVPETSVHHTGDDSTVFDRMRQTLQTFSKAVLWHPDISTASPKDKTNLVNEVKAFLLAHLSQIEYNSLLQQQHSAQPTSASDTSATTIIQSHSVPSFKDWLTKTSAIHTSCPYSWTFALCLMSARPSTAKHLPANTSTAPLRTNKSRYIATELCAHLSSLCRLYNDLGSVARDAEECNLNCVNFADFHEPGDASMNEVKDRMKRVGDFERKMVYLAMAELEKTVDARVMDMVRVFVDITDAFGQMYEVKDLASRRTNA